MYRPCSHMIMDKLKTSLLRPKLQNTDLDDSVETIDPYFKFKLLVEELLVIFTKCEDKCGVCVEYIVKLCQHIGDTHDNGHELDTDDVSDSSDFIHHPSPNNSESTCNPVHPINLEDASTSSKSSNMNVSTSRKKILGAEPSTDDNSPQNISRSHEDVNEGDNSVKFSSRGDRSCTSPSNTQSTAINSKAQRNKSNLNRNTFIHISCESCKFCGKVFPNRNRLERHLLTHTGEKPFECETCGKCFTSKHNLKDHKHIHTGQRPYKCDMCDTLFRHASNLIRHKLHSKCKRNKSNDKRTVILNPQKCLKCGKMFRNTYALNAHSKVHGAKKRNYRFYCETCGKGFFYNYSLVKHQSTHTGEKHFR